MEMLNYSLWFTLIWWTTIVGIVIVSYYITPNHIKEKSIENAKRYGTISDIYFIVYIPSIAILLEYLIVR